MNKETLRKEAIDAAEVLSNAERLENHYMFYDLVEMYEKGARYSAEQIINKAVELVENMFVPIYISPKLKEKYINDFKKSLKNEIF